MIPPGRHRAQSQPARDRFDVQHSAFGRETPMLRARRGAVDGSATASAASHRAGRAGGFSVRPRRRNGSRENILCVVGRYRREANWSTRHSPADRIATDRHCRANPIIIRGGLRRSPEGARGVRRRRPCPIPRGQGVRNTIPLAATGTGVSGKTSLLPSCPSLFNPQQ